MYNNEITYNDKWKTPDNNKALNKLSKYINRSTCASDCPLSWAPEVLTLLEKLDNELGIARNTTSIKGYRIADTVNIIKGLLLISFITCLIRNIFHHAKNTIKPSKYYVKRSISRKIYQCHYDATMHGLIFPLESFKIKFINPIINKILKPKLYLGQVKEKYGELVIYYTTECAFEEYVEKQITKTKIMLSQKGAYYSLDKLWDAHRIERVNCEYNPENYEVHLTEDGSKSLKRSLYRAAIKDAGIDIGQFLAKKE